MTKNSTKNLKGFGLLGILTLVLAGCGNSSPANGNTSNSSNTNSQEAYEQRLAKYYTQNVRWSDCIEDITWMAEIIELDTGKLECALINVPSDYDDLSKKDTQLYISRYTDTAVDNKLGSIIIHPGAQGIDGIGQAPGLYYLIKRNPAQTESIKELLKSYHFVSFSPRGVGDSVRAICNSLSDYKFESPAWVNSESNLEALYYNAGIISDSCYQNPMNRHLSTKNTARDMDIMRALVGDKKLNYIGYSYGSWLGGRYAREFPNNVGRMLLDSNVDLTNEFNHTTNGQSAAFLRTLKEGAAPYIARQHDLYGLGNSASQIVDNYMSLPDEVRRIFQSSSSLVDSLYTPSRVHTTAVNLLAAKGFAEIIKDFSIPASAANSYDQRYELFLELRQKLAAHQYIPQEIIANNPDAADINIEAGDMASDYAVAYGYIQNYLQLPNPINAISPDMATFYSVVCNDRERNLSKQEAFKIGKGQNSFFGATAAADFCQSWETPVDTRPTTELNAIAPILFLQSEGDAPTPREGAFQSIKAFGQSRMIFVDNEYGNSLFPYGHSCVDDRVARYFLGNENPAEANAKAVLCNALPIGREDKPSEFGADGLSLLQAEGFSVVDRRSELNSKSISTLGLGSNHSNEVAEFREEFRRKVNLPVIR